MGKIIDETGNKHGRLTVLYMTPREPGKPVKWHCKCDCGKEIDVVGTMLRSGNTKSCGCLHKEQLAERNASKSSVKIGNKYSMLTVIKDLGMRKQESRDKNERWSLCQCDCGNIVEVKNNMLQNGWKKSCGCTSSSFEEKRISQILEQNNIFYIKEYSFSDLYYQNINAKLRFDFAIFKDNQLRYLIEFDGKQHIKEKAGWGESLENIQARNNIKNKYCKENNIPLIRIPYTHYENLCIEDLIPETSKFLI